MFLVKLLGKSLQILSLEDSGDEREGSSIGEAVAEKTVGGKTAPRTILGLDPQLRVWAREPPSASRSPVPPATSGRNTILGIVLEVIHLKS